MNVIYILLLLGALVWLTGLVMRRYAIKGLEYKRKFDRNAYFAGATAQMIETVRNDRPVILPWLRVQSRLPASFLFGKQQNLDIAGSMYHRSIFFLMPHQQITRRHRVRLMKRGAYDLGNATLTAGDLLGMHAVTQQVRTDYPILVYPRLLDEDRIPPAFLQAFGEWIAERSLMTDPFLISGIRPYRAGDNVRDIHWAATARTQELQVRTHEYVERTKLLVLINGQTRQDQWSAVSEHDAPVIEYAISLAATICMKVLRSGLEAGFGVNMSAVQEDRCTLFLPEGGPARDEVLLAAFARLRMGMPRSFVGFLQELPPLDDADILLITAYESDAIHEQIDRLQRQGSNVLLCLIDRKEAERDA